MNIDDLFDGFLKQEKCKSLNKYLTHTMYNSADKDLVSRMLDVFDEVEDDALNWFYSPLTATGGKRPYDLCKEGNSQEVEKILGRIEHGICS